MLFFGPLLDQAGRFQNGGQAENNFLLAYFDIFQIGAERLGHRIDRKVNPAGLQRLVEGGCSVLHDAYFVFGVHPLKGRQDVGQHITPPGRCDADGEGAHGLRADVGKGIVELMVQIQDFEPRIHILLPGIGQIHLIVNAVKEPDVQALLQILEKFGEGRLGDVEKTGRAGEGLIFFNGEDVLDFAEVHVSSFLGI